MVKLSSGVEVDVLPVPPFALMEVAKNFPEDEGKVDEFAYMYAFQNVEVPDDWEFPAGLRYIREPRTGYGAKVDYVRFCLLETSYDIEIVQRVMYGDDVGSIAPPKDVPGKNAKIITLSNGNDVTVHMLPPLLLAEVSKMNDGIGRDVMFGTAFKDVVVPDGWEIPDILKQYGIESGHEVVDYVVYSLLSRPVDLSTCQEVMYGNISNREEVVERVDAMFRSEGEGETVTGSAAG